MTQTPEQRRLIRLANTINTKARKVGADGEVTASDLAIVYLRTRKCHYCGVELTLGHYSFDHVVAFDRGGNNWIQNIVTSCFKCNREKFTKTLQEVEFYRDLIVRCEVCLRQYKPRYAEWLNGRAKTCSRSCAAAKRWATPKPGGPTHGN